MPPRRGESYRAPRERRVSLVDRTWDSAQRLSVTSAPAALVAPAVPVEEAEALPAFGDLLRRGFVHPHCKFRRTWDLVTTYFVLYTALFLPFRLAFDVPATGAWKAKDYFMDGLFICDFFLNFLTGIVVKGEVVLDHRRIALTYLSSWAAVDFVSSFPFDWMVGGGDEGSETAVRSTKLARLTRVMKIVRLVRLSRAARMGRLMRKLEEVVSLKYGLIEAAKFLLVTLVTAHWLGCFFFALPQLSDFPEDSWTVSYGITDSPVFTQYVVCFYWAITTMSTIGYGDITPGNSAERVYTVFCMFVGGGVFAYGITSLCNIVASLNLREVTYRRTMDELNEYLEFFEVPKETRLNAKKFLLFCKSSSVGAFFDKPTILARLPAVLRAQVVMTSHTRALKSSSLLAAAPDDDVRRRLHAAIAVGAQGVVMAPGDIVSDPEGDVVGGRAGPRHVFLLVDGVVKEMYRAYAVWRHESGGVFGHPHVFGRNKHPVKFVCETCCELYSLPIVVVHQIEDKAPGFIRKLEEDHAMARLRTLALVEIERVALRQWAALVGVREFSAPKPSEEAGASSDEALEELDALTVEQLQQRLEEELDVEGALEERVERLRVMSTPAFRADAVRLLERLVH